MKTTNLREKLLKRVRNASMKIRTRYEINEPDFKSPIFKRSEESMAELFAKEFNKNNGKFIYCKNNPHFISQFIQLVQANHWSHIYCTEEKISGLFNDTELKLKKKLVNYTSAEVGITSCEALLARTGSIIVTSGTDKPRAQSVFPPVHIIVAYFDQIFFDMDNALNYLKDKYDNHFPSMISIISGPSRTADIEKTLVLGAHGPRDIYCFFINER